MILQMVSLSKKDSFNGTNEARFALHQVYSLLQNQYIN